MAKYMVLYSSSANARDIMAQATPEEMKAGMDSWIKWKDEAEKDIKVEFGLPMQAINKITPEGAAESSDSISGYSILEGDKDKILELLKNHPHLTRPDAYIELLEMLPMPGLNAS